MRVTINGYGVFFRSRGGDENVIVVMVAQVCEHTKNHGFVHFKSVNGM